MKSSIALLIAAIVLSACSTVPSAVPNALPVRETQPPPAVTPPHTTTPAPTPTVTLPPAGGGALLTAFYASGNCGNCIIVGDFFTGAILHTIPLSAYQTGKIFWSPDGKNILYSDRASRMNVLLFNLETGQTKKLGDFPASGGTPEHVNDLKNVRWSYDSAYVMFDAYVEDGTLQKSYYAASDGTSSSYEGGMTDWFPDSRTMFSIYGGEKSYNVESHAFATAYTAALSDFKASYILQDYILLEQSKARVSAIPFPEDWINDDPWLYDALAAQIFTLAELAPEISNKTISLKIIQRIDENRIALIGSAYTSSKYGYFVKLVDLQTLPAVIGADDLMQTASDLPLIVSPDANYYVKAFCTFLETCPHYDPNWKNRIPQAWGFVVVGWDGAEQALPSDLSQFQGVTKAGVQGLTAEGVLDGIAFHWK